jgi:hypothetical protein
MKHGVWKQFPRLSRKLTAIGAMMVPIGCLPIPKKVR